MPAPSQVNAGAGPSHRPPCAPDSPSPTPGRPLTSPEFADRCAGRAAPALASPAEAAGIDRRCRCWRLLPAAVMAGSISTRALLPHRGTRFNVYPWNRRSRGRIGLYSPQRSHLAALIRSLPFAVVPLTPTPIEKSEGSGYVELRNGPVPFACIRKILGVSSGVSPGWHGARNGLVPRFFEDEP